MIRTDEPNNRLKPKTICRDYTYKNTDLQDSVTRTILECYGAYKKQAQARAEVKKKLGINISYQTVQYYYTNDRYAPDRQNARNVYNKTAEYLCINSAVKRLEELEWQWERCKEARKSGEMTFREYLREVKEIFAQAREEEGLKKNPAKINLTVEGDLNINQQFNMMASLPDRYLERIERKEIDLQTAMKLYEAENAPDSIVTR